MRAAPARLAILVPGLFTPQPALDALPAAERPDWRILEGLLARADRRRRPPARADAVLARLLGLGDRPPPLAAVTAAADGLPGRAGWWLRADPVCLLPDRDQLRMVEHRPRLTADESAALVAELNAHLAADGLQVEAPVPERWYLQAVNDEPLGGAPLPAVAGDAVTEHLPAGVEAAWRQRLNEIQMLLHAHPVNARREARGELPINSVWFWGGGRWPAVAGNPPARIFTDDDTVAALGRALAVPVHAIAALPEAATEGTNLLVDTRLWSAAVRQDPLAWMEGVSTFQATIETFMTRSMKSANTIIELHDPRGQCFRLLPRHRWRVWRRRRALTTLAVA